MNINEIAALAGVSRATVSRYLNNGYVSREKKEIIAKVIKETGYVPSSQAKMLRTKKTNIIGVIVPKINSDAVSREVAGISEILQHKGYQILMANTDNNERKEIEYLKVFQNNQVDGIILIGTIFTREHKKALMEMNVPVVILGQNFQGFSSVYHDDYEAAKELTKKMIEKGRKQIGYIGVPLKDEAAGKGRYYGYLDAFKECQRTVLEQAMEESDFTIEGGYKRAVRLFDRFPDLDGVFCATDRIAIGALKRLKELGKKVPEQVAVTGFGHTSLSQVVTPRLTTVHFHYKTSGMEAATLLLTMITNEEKILRDLKMGYEIIEQESL